MKYRRMRVPGGTYFFTVVTAGRKPILAYPDSIAALMGHTENVRVHHPFDIDAYVILPDHLHAIWTLPEGDSNFSTRWMLIKSAFARSFGKGQPVWQNRFWEHLIHSDEDFSNHIEYIHYNPVKHGFVAAPRDWPHSSFHGFVASGDYESDWGSGEVRTWPTAMICRSE